MKTNLIIFITSLLLILGCETELEYCWACGENLIDERDGQNYRTKQFGDQCWMIDNLRTGKCLDKNKRQESSINNIIEHYCSSECQTNCFSGGLYKWDEIKESPCPKGWHVPSKSALDKLCQNIINGRDCPPNNQGDIDHIMRDFNIEYNGYLTNWFTINGLSNQTGFWSSDGDQVGSDEAFVFFVNYVEGNNLNPSISIRTTELLGPDKKSGFHIRCIKDK